MKPRLPLDARWIVITGFALAAGSLAYPANGQGAEESDWLQTAGMMIADQTNEFRKAHGREPLSTNEKLTKTAREFADFMQRNDKYGHDADGRTPAERVARHGYEYCLVAENIAWYELAMTISASALAGQFMKGWQESPRHRENMLDAGMTEIGVAIARRPAAGVDRYYVVQLFGRPQSAAIRFQVANSTSQEIAYTLEGVVNEEGKLLKFELPPRATRYHNLCQGSSLRLAGDPRARPVAIAGGYRYRVRNEGETLEVTREPIEKAAQEPPQRPAE